MCCLVSSCHVKFRAPLNGFAFKKMNGHHVEILRVKNMMYSSMHIMTCAELDALRVARTEVAERGYTITEEDLKKQITEKEKMIESLITEVVNLKKQLKEKQLGHGLRSCG